MTSREGYDITIKQGEDYIKYFQWTLGNGSTPMPITGFTGVCQIRKDAQDAIVIAEPLVTVVDGINGVFKVTIDHSVTSTIPVNGKSCYDMIHYVYDVKLISASNIVYRVLQGYAKISPEVTK